MIDLVLRSAILFFFVLLSLFSFSQQSHFILAIGDSHGAEEMGWVNQLRKLRPTDSIMNVAVSGNTIGFDNLGKESLNELSNINDHLSEANKVGKRIDYIILLLGTNDCKAIFDSLQHEVAQNLDKLIRMVRMFRYQQQEPPVIILATPPPIDVDEKLEPKYFGSLNRLKKLLPIYQSTAKKYNCSFVNVYDHLSKDFPSISKDGVHLTEDGYKKIALLLNKQISQRR
ncbi:MAG TPA: GDSL-type esterase/lipase family protein [Cyclobacteriaceae bacterium]|nr:GDSL-type esterase/lipase family protein [Cyclobacteriaceae bacterium]